ncbi:MAG: RagB/SusD family nutrient uptake outer membrane protein [Acidobacterium ailaaui]|nr:RagB/SusD family nutrient uptake outer membrane protein [Pseudacidobacterium ailaaui]
MKRYIFILSVLSIFSLVFTSCNKNRVIDLYPKSYISTSSFYHTYNDLSLALAGCYRGLQAPLQYEWMLTELRSDNVYQWLTGSSSPTNLDLNDLDMYRPSPTLPEIYSYWLPVYTNIRSINYVLQSLGVTYSNSVDSIGKPIANVTDDQRNELAGEALFLRAYHYFNLVRLFGGVFLVTTPVSPQQAQLINRSSVDDCYKLIVADLTASIQLLPRVSYNYINSADLGKATVWAAEALLAKVYLTLHQNANALPLLDDVINNSGYGLLSNYADVFSTSNEMNKEILFAVRFKAGGYGLGNFMPNYFAPLSSGSAIVNGDGLGYDYPSDDLDSAFNANDQRFSFSIGTYQSRRYAKKFVVPVAVPYDGENDFPILRFSDVLLMKAEAIGFDGSNGTSVSIINTIRARAGAQPYTSGNFNSGFYLYPTDPSDSNSINSQDKFVQALLNERRLEFAFENQRLFDLIRFGQAIPVLQNYFANEYAAHYSQYSPQPTIQELQSNVNTDHLILPIPQREIDANTTITIQQNPGY